VFEQTNAQLHSPSRRGFCHASATRLPDPVPGLQRSPPRILPAARGKAPHVARCTSFNPPGRRVDGSRFALHGEADEHRSYTPGATTAPARRSPHLDQLQRCHLGRTGRLDRSIRAHGGVTQRHRKTIARSSLSVTTGLRHDRTPEEVRIRRHIAHGHWRMSLWSPARYEWQRRAHHPHAR
jgi:hypothetical protein